MVRVMRDDYELIAKRCPLCNSLIMAKNEQSATGDIKYMAYMCSNCHWVSPFSKSA